MQYFTYARAHSKVRRFSLSYRPADKDHPGTNVLKYPPIGSQFFDQTYSEIVDRRRKTTLVEATRPEEHQDNKPCGVRGPAPTLSPREVLRICSVEL